MLKVGGSVFAAEICTGLHNRLLRRQHCSSLCSQSEGHEHVANMAGALGHDLVGFSVVLVRHNIRPPSLHPPSFATQLQKGVRNFAENKTNQLWKKKKKTRADVGNTTHWNMKKTIAAAKAIAHMKKNTATMKPSTVVAAIATKPLPGIPPTITGSHKGIAITTTIMEASAGKSFRLSCRHCCSSAPLW